jgi:hypothetical protein
MSVHIYNHWTNSPADSYHFVQTVDKILEAGISEKDLEKLLALAYHAGEVGEIYRNEEFY